MGHPAHRAQEVSDIGEQPEESVTGVGVPNVLLVTMRELQRGDVLGARYQIEAVIGTGGSGRVLRAFDREARTPVALKILRPEFAADPVWAERFSRELRIGRSIIHPNVCRVFDIGDADGHKFLSMELASRGSIRGEVPRIGVARMAPTRPPRPWTERVADARAVVQGVAALHAAGIIHRDIKPENILRMDDGRVVVTDFGLATDPGANPGNTVMVGTPSYMAPEVVMGDPATARSDVWGLGIVVHEILFGCRPQWKAIGRGYRRFVPPDDLTSTAERAAAALCGRCADDSPEVRPASAVEVGSELARALRGKRRFTRPGHRTAVWAALALASFAMLGLIRERWSNRAQASRSGAAGSMEERMLTPTGTPEDWSKGATKLAAFPGRLHCYSLVEGGKKVRVIWGTPRRAEDVDVNTGERTRTDLVPETYQEGCPALSPDGRGLLFEKSNDNGTHIFFQPSRGEKPRQIVRGASPTWMSNGQEFVFLVDSRHAATFSLPTGEMTVIVDGIEDPRQLGDYSIDQSGGKIAVRYWAGREQNEIVVHVLPTLRVIGRVSVPPTAEHIQFGPNDRISFAMDGPDGFAMISSANFQSHALKTVGAISHADVYGFLEVANQRIIANRRLRKDLWAEGQGQKEVITSDGQSLHGSRSIAGDFAIQRRLPNGRLVIVLRDSSGGERQLTQGPFDVTPTFSPGIGSLLYARLDRSDLVECSGTAGPCVSIHADELIPAFPSPSLDGKQIAYLTLKNSARLRIFSRDRGDVRDLGPAGGDACTPLWTASNRIWISSAVKDQVVRWTEINSETGQRTGSELHVASEIGRDCVVPPEIVRIQEELGRPTVFAVADETSELTLVSALQPLLTTN